MVDFSLRSVLKAPGHTSTKLGVLGSVAPSLSAFGTGAFSTSHLRISRVTIHHPPTSFSFSDTHSHSHTHTHTHTLTHIHSHTRQNAYCGHQCSPTYARTLSHTHTWAHLPLLASLGLESQLLLHPNVLRSLDSGVCSLSTRDPLVLRASSSLLAYLVLFHLKLARLVNPWFVGQLVGSFVHPHPSPNFTLISFI